VVDLEAVDQEGGAKAAVTLFIGQLVIVGMYRDEYNKVCQVMRLAGSGRIDRGMMQYSVYTVLGVRCTRCMLYSVLTHEHCMER